jgi:hypothetical protein
MQALCFCAKRNKRRNKHAILHVISTNRDLVMSSIETALSFLDQGRVSLIVGILVAGVTFLWSRKRTSLAYVHLGEHLLGSASDALPSAIVVQYDGISIPRLTKTILIIWNSGENTVSGSDIVDKDPLRLKIGDDGRILSISVLKTSRTVNDFRIRTASNDATNEAPFTFDFLDANDGVAVEVLHTSADRKPSVNGTMRGLPRGFRNLGKFTRPKPQKKNRSGPLFTVFKVASSPFILVCVGLLFALYGPHPTFLVELTRDSSFFTGLMGGLGGFFGMWIINSWATRRRYPKSLHLETLE